MPFPASEDSLCLLVAHLFDEGLLHRTIKRYLSAICHMRIVQGLGDPFIASWPRREYVLRGGETPPGKVE